jgi:hypothetical protein
MTTALDLVQAKVAFRDRPVMDVLDLALRFIVVHARSYALVAVAVLVPAALASLACGAALGWPWAWAVALPLSVAAQVPFTVLASRLVFEERVPLRRVLHVPLADLSRLFVGRLLATTLIAFGTLLLFVPGLFIAPLFVFVSEVTLLERQRVFHALTRAQRLASTAMGDVVVGTGALTFVTMASVVVADIAGRSILREVLQFKEPPPLWVAHGGTLATLGLFAQVPYLATSRFFLYLNVRTRAEGWDIQTRFAAIAEQSRAATEDTRAA